MDNNVKIFLSVIVLLILGVLSTVLLRGSSVGPNTPGMYDTFASCIKDSGATFYGAFWCPHCQSEKKLFGSSAKLLPYVECSTADASAQTQICIDKNIASYPTWEFKDGTRLTGEIPLAQLAEKTGCVLPNADGSTPAANVDSSTKSTVK